MVEASAPAHIVSGTLPSWAYPRAPTSEALTQFFSPAAQAFEPGALDIFITISTGQQQRLIFTEPLPLKENEIEYLANFRKYLVDNKLTIPEG